MDVTLTVFYVRNCSGVWRVGAQDPTGGALFFSMPKEWGTPRFGDEIVRYQQRRDFRSPLARMDLNGKTVYRANA